MARREISDDDKRKAVSDWITGKRKATQICADLKVTSGQLSAWKKKAQADSYAESVAKAAAATAAPPVAAEKAKDATASSPVAAVIASPSGKKPRTDKETKARAVAEYEKGERSAKEIGAEYGVADVTIYAWVKAARKKGPATGVAELPASYVGVDAGRMFLQKAVSRMHQIACPSCGHTFAASPPGVTESLVTLAAHMLSGEEL